MLDGPGAEPELAQLVEAEYGLCCALASSADGRVNEGWLEKVDRMCRFLDAASGTTQVFSEKTCDVCDTVCCNSTQGR